MLTLAFDAQSVKAEPETWTVDDNGPADFSTIQEAINAASDGYTIFVRMGTYYENIVVNRTVLLTGEDSSTTIIDGNGTGHVVIITSDDVNMTGFTVQNSGTAYHITGINLNNVNHCNVSGNIITNNEHGLEIHNSSYYNTISGNNMTENNKWGMHIIDSHGNNVSGNIIGGSIWGSIAVHGFSTHNRIFENNVGNNDNGGISIDGSDYNDIYENNITNNLWGISVQYGAKYNAISRNCIANNNYSVKLEWNTFANMFYHNNLVDNVFRMSLVGYNYANSWDDGYPSGGNYWSDYNGTDLFSGLYQNETGSDGIGDTTCVIDENYIDHYPLIGMFFDHLATSEHHVQTICNSTLSDFQFNGTAIRFNVSGENSTTGFCRICIPTALMNETYRVFVNGTEVSCNLLTCSNETHSYLYFNYTHSTQEVTIIPEFPSLLILLLFMMATLVAVMVYNRKPTVILDRGYSILAYKLQNTLY
jgi:parallel beta-helix repeat protein